MFRRLSLLVLIPLLLTPGCGGKKERPETQPRVYRIAILPGLRESDIDPLIRRGAETRARELGNVHILWPSMGRDDAPIQVRILDGLVASDVDGIAVSCADPLLLLDPINRAIERGISVITFDGDSPASNRIAFCGVSDFEMGRMLGTALAERTGRRGTYAFLSGARENPNLEERIRGAREALAHHPEMTEAGVFHCNSDRRRAVTLIQEVMSKNPNLAGWVMLGQWPFHLKGALDGVNSSKTKVVVAEAGPVVWPYIAEGRVHYALSSRPYDWGYRCVDILYRLILENGDVSAHTDFELDVITPQTIEEHIRKWTERFVEPSEIQQDARNRDRTRSAPFWEDHGLTLPNLLGGLSG